jgi:hypothetical protein
MKLVLLLCAFALSCSNAAFAMGKNRPEGSLRNTLKVSEIHVARDNALAGGWKSSASCGDTFLGTHSENAIHFEAIGSGGGGKYHHTLIYTISDAFDVQSEKTGQFQKTRSDNGEFVLKFPQLKPDTSFVQQTVFLITEDQTGTAVTTSRTFTISRPIILGVSNDPQALKMNCFERYAANPSSLGVISNGSTNLSSIQIKQGIQKLWSKTKGWQWGVYVSPLSYFGLGNILSLNASYFTQTSKQTVETVEISSEYQINPGDFMQVYVQPTRYITAYDATMVGPCGESEKLPGAYLFQWWGFAYHVYPINPFDRTSPPAEAIGVPIMNTCSKDLSPLTFMETNQ